MDGDGKWRRGSRRRRFLDDSQVLARTSEWQGRWGNQGEARFEVGGQDHESESGYVESEEPLRHPLGGI